MASRPPGLPGKRGGEWHLSHTLERKVTFMEPHEPQSKHFLPSTGSGETKTNIQGLGYDGDDRYYREVPPPVRLPPVSKRVVVDCDEDDKDAGGEDEIMGGVDDEYDDENEDEDDDEDEGENEDEDEYADGDKDGVDYTDDTGDEVFTDVDGDVAMIDEQSEDEAPTYSRIARNDAVQQEPSKGKGIEVVSSKHEPPKPKKASFGNAKPSTYFKGFTLQPAGKNNWPSFEHAQWLRYQKVDLLRTWPQVISDFVIHFQHEPPKALQDYFYGISDIVALDEDGNAVIDRQGRHQFIKVTSRLLKQQPVLDGVPVTLVERYPWEALAYNYVSPEHKRQAKAIVEAIDSKRVNQYTRTCFYSDLACIHILILATGKEQYTVAVREFEVRKRTELESRMAAKLSYTTKSRKARPLMRDSGNSDASNSHEWQKMTELRKVTAERDNKHHSFNDIDKDFSLTKNLSATLPRPVATERSYLISHPMAKIPSQISRFGQESTASHIPGFMQTSALEVAETYDSVELIALHLACSPHFHQAMRTVGNLDSRSLNTHWLCSLDLPEREIPKYSDDIAWLEHYRRSRKEKDIINRATEIWEALPRTLRTPLEGPIQGPTPLFNDHWTAIREDLFRYHEMRWDLLETEKRLDELRSVMESEETHQQSKQMLTLKTAEKDCQIALSATTFQSKVVREIDTILLGIPYSFAPSVYEGSGLASHKAAISEIMRRYDVDFGLPQHRSKFRSVNYSFLKAADLPTHDYPISCNPLSSTLSQHGSLADHDKRLASEVSFIFEEVEINLFETTFLAFFGIDKRLDEIKTMAPIESRDLDPRDLLHDNLAHARLHFDMLKAVANDGLEESPMNDIWRRLVAIVALCYGCTSEPSFFLTTMDHQLGALRAAVGKLPFHSV